MCLSSFALEGGDAILICTSFPSWLPRTCADRAGGQAPNTLAARWPAGCSAFLCQSFPTFPPALSEVRSQSTSCFLQLLQSSERVGAGRSDIAPKVEAVWKKNILISTYLKNIIRNWKKKNQQSLFCFAFSPLLSKFRGLWLPITQDAMLKGRPRPIKTFEPGPYFFTNGTPSILHLLVFVLLLKRII